VLLGKLGLGLAAFLRAAGTAALHVAYRLAAYAERRLALGSTGVRRGGRITILIGINRFLTWVDSYHTVHVRHPHYLVTYLHQLTSPSSYPVLPQDCSLLRLAVFALRAATVSGGVRVEGSLLVCSLLVSSPRRLEWALARPPCGQRTAHLDSGAVPQPSTVASVGRVAPHDLNLVGGTPVGSAPTISIFSVINQ
jgi:hypothetical protein